MANQSNWKGSERALAARLGGERISNHALGMQTPDVETRAWSVEVKCRKVLPFWLTDALAQARRNATDGKLALVILHQVGQRHDNDVVVLRLDDFVEWFGTED